MPHPNPARQSAARRAAQKRPHFEAEQDSRRADRRTPAGGGGFLSRDQVSALDEADEVVEAFQVVNKIHEAERGDGRQDEPSQGAA